MSEAVRAGHLQSLALLEDTEAIRTTRALYSAHLEGGVYLRPTAKGLTVISLERTPAMVGVGDRGSEYLRSIPPSGEDVVQAVAEYREKVAAMGLRKKEEQYSIGLVRRALDNELRLPGGLQFICQEWRFPSRSKIDILAVDPTDGFLVVVELKDVESKAPDGRRQAQAYAAEWAEHETLFPFFERLHRAMARVHGFAGDVAFASTEPRVDCWWPKSGTGR